MPNKTLISIAVASSIALTGCLDDGSTGKNANPTYPIEMEQYSGKTWPRFAPIAGDLPIPSDLNFRSDVASTDVNEADGSFQVLTDDPNPVTEALNQLSGASTVAPPVVQFDGRIDESTVDSRAFVLTGDPANPVIPNPSQNVFLIELDYASGDPVRALSIGERPTIPVAVTAQMALAGDPASGAALVDLAQNPRYEAEVVTLDGDSAIRINPTTPLKPFTRYIVVVTKEVLDINGDPIIQAPTYNNLTSDTPIINAALTRVRTLINSFWEPLATTYFGLNNAVRGENALTADDIALSYSFTTSNDERVLAYIARPEAYFEETLTGALRVGAAQAVLAQNPSAGYNDIKPVADSVVTDAGFQTTDIHAALKNAGIFTFASQAGCTVESVECAGVGLAVVNLSSATPESPPKPADRSATAAFDAPRDVYLVSAVTAQVGIQFGEVNLVQGTIELPYYLGVPGLEGDGSEAPPSVINSQSWEADAGLAGQIGSQLGVNFGQSEPSNSQVVNYRFPFPREVTKVRVPIMVFYPAGATLNDGSLPVTMYMHGITADRSAALTFGSLLARSSQSAVVVIDQPLHGVAPFSAEEQRALADRLLTAGAEQGLPGPTETNIDALIAGQLTYGTTASLLDSAGAIDTSDGIDATEDATIKGTISAALTTGTGNAQLDAAVRALTSFENTVANAGSTVPGIARTEHERHFDFTASAQNTPVPMNFDKDNAFGDSGSLYINLTNFTNSRDKNRQAVVDLMNVRASLAGLDFAGGAGADLNAGAVSFTGHSLGTIVGAPFVAVVNEGSEQISHTHLLTPGAGIVRMLENSPTFAPRILGGLSAAAGLQQGDAALETFFNVNQAALDAVDPINFANNLVASNSKVLLSQVNGDQVIPNEAQEETLGAAFKAYLSGTEPLADELNAVAVTPTSTPVDLTTPPTAAITRYIEGTHSTPVLPQGGPLDQRVFGEMIGQNVWMLNFDAVEIQDPAPADIIQQE